VLNALALTFKGLTFDELKRISSCNDQELKLVLNVFNYLTINTRGFIVFRNQSLKKKIKKKFLENEKEILAFHEDINHNVGWLSVLSIRKLEE